LQLHIENLSTRTTPWYIEHANLFEMITPSNIGQFECNISAVINALIARRAVYYKYVTNNHIGNDQRSALFCGHYVHN